MKRQWKQWKQTAVKMAALALLAGVAHAQSDFFVPALDNIEPVGSNPKANQMTEAEFEAYTADLRARYAQFIENYAPDYTGDNSLLGPPRQGRLLSRLPLARNGRARAEIIADFSPERHTPEATLGREDYPPEVAVMRHVGHRVVENAVHELKYWLDALTGADFSVHSAPRISPTKIFVGADFARAHFADDLERLGEGENLDGFAVRTRGRDIYIFGATAKGTMNGVFAFIENNSDLIWAHSVGDLGTVYTVDPNLEAVWGNALEKPGTVQRGWVGNYEEVDGRPSRTWMWMMRNRNNLVVSSRLSPQRAEWGCWREAGGHMLGTFIENNIPDPGRFFPWIPDSESGELKQPERIHHYRHNICMTHPDLPELYAEAAVKRFRGWRNSNPRAPLSGLKIAQEDPAANHNYGLCMCARCQRPIQLPDGRIIPVQNAVHEGLEFRTAQYYLLLEKIARAMAAEFPDARLSTYAYYFSAEPPPFQTIVQPWLCPHGKGGRLRHRGRNMPLFSSYNQRWWNYAYGWSRITDKTVMYDYHGLLGEGAPFALTVDRDMRSMLPMGISRYIVEIGRGLNAPFVHMDSWVANRLYWNPDADVERLTAYYLQRTFREGAPAMARFFATIHTWWYAQHRRPEDFVNFGWIIAQTGKVEALHNDLREALEQTRHRLAHVNLARMLETFEDWFNLNREGATRKAMLRNAKLGRFEAFPSEPLSPEAIPVSYVTFDDPAPRESAPLFGDADRAQSDFEGWTFQARIAPVGETESKRFPPPLLAVGHADGDEVVWSPAVEPRSQRDGSFLYSMPLQRMAGFDPSQFSRIALGYRPVDWRAPDDFVAEFALFDLQLLDPNANAYVMPTLAARERHKALRRWP